LFIRQSIQSDYCAVYATAMCLSASGTPTSRKEALRLFGARARQWAGASHADIRRAVVAMRPDIRSRWVHIRQPTPQNVVHALELVAARGAPAIVAAFCRHRHLGLTCGHAFVLIPGHLPRLAILDPLGRPPLALQSHNAEIERPDKQRQRLLAVRGSPWDISLDKPVSLLRVPVLADRRMHMIHLPGATTGHDEENHCRLKP
jgi:hypothetical protein